MARRMRRGLSKFYFVPTIADPSAPTVAEISAGTEIGQEVAEISGFSFSSNPIDTPDFESRFVKKAPGEDTAEDSSMTLYDDPDTVDIRDTLAKDEEGYIVIFALGIAGASPAAGDDAEVWPVQVASNTREYTAGNEVARYMVQFTITDVPEQNAVVAA